MAAAEAKMQAFQQQMAGNHTMSSIDETTVRARARGLLGKARQAAVAAAERMDVTLANAHEGAVAKAKAAATSASASVQAWREDSTGAAHQSPAPTHQLPPQVDLLGTRHVPAPEMNLSSIGSGVAASVAAPAPALDLLSMKW